MVSRAVYPQYRRGGRFFGRRVNCERVPMLPAQVVRRILDDPRHIPYLLIWEGDNAEVKEAVRVIRLGPPPYLPTADSIEIKRTDGSVTHIRAIKWSLPRNGGYAILLACPHCCSLRRALYGWEPGGRFTTSVQRSQWHCRRCAGLRYASEGGALLIRTRGSLGRLFGVGRSDRPALWYPYVFTSPQQASEAGLCTLK